ncbi:hypothetical protein EMMF5_003952 [Cystobasidiomycetes sp. EMM_F5]
MSEKQSSFLLPANLELPVNMETKADAFEKGDLKRGDLPEGNFRLVDVSETDLSLGNILRGSAAAPLSNFDRKAALINACAPISR